MSRQLDRQPEGYHQPLHRDAEVWVKQLKKGQTMHLESILQFLEEDPYLYNSGYLKEKLWRYLRRVPLTEEQKERLRRVALLYVRIRLSREFFSMCLFVRGIATDEFREQVRALKGSRNGRVRHRAILLSAYLKGLKEGHTVRTASYWRQHPESSWPGFDWPAGLDALPSLISKAL